MHSEDKNDKKPYWYWPVFVALLAVFSISLPLVTIWAVNTVFSTNIPINLGTLFAVLWFHVLAESLVYRYMTAQTELKNKKEMLKLTRTAAALADKISSTHRNEHKEYL